MPEPTHIRGGDSDAARDIQLAVHAIMYDFVARGFCPECVMLHIATGANVVAREHRCSTYIECRAATASRCANNVRDLAAARRERERTD
jgi:hypothetical protein